MQGFKFKVFSAHQAFFTREVQLEGKTIKAEVPGLVVELVNDDHSMTVTRRFVPDDMDAALALYTPGAEITSTDEQTAPAPAPAPVEPAPQPETQPE